MTSQSVRMSLKVNLDVKDGTWRPGSPLINDPRYNLQHLSHDQKLEILNKFSEFLASTMVRLLKERITTQYRYLRWAPLTQSYQDFKKAMGLSENIWEATGLLLNSITYYKKDNFYYVGINPRKKYPGNKVSVLFVAKCMEFGTKYMPARPLFGPTVSFMRRNIRKYWELFLRDSIIGGL